MTQLIDYSFKYLDSFKRLVVQDVLTTRDKFIRNELIKLGWTPPDSGVYELGVELGQHYIKCKICGSVTRIS